MIDGKALLAGILEHPEDDVRRLVYADWLEETGKGERAEFIRVQVEEAAIEAAECRCGDVDPTGCVRCRKLRRLRRYYQERRWGPMLLAELPEGWNCQVAQELAGRGGTGALYRRGFIVSVLCPLAAWLEHGPTLVRAHPVERVEASDRTPAHPHPHNRWCWVPADGWRDAGHPHLLPRDVWRLLPNDSTQGRSLDAARDALSSALLAHARSRTCDGPGVTSLAATTVAEDTVVE